jgi:uncharacterized repeat protein (TIGR01451 family)
MWFPAILSWPRGVSKSTSPGRPRKFLPVLEALEERQVPAIFNVTSLLDSNAAGSGALRRAITDANATAGPNQIRILTPGTYRLTLNGTDDDNSAGDLDILNNGVTIANQSGGSVVIDAGGLTTPDRVIDVTPLGGAIAVTITGVTIQAGSVSPGKFGGFGGGIQVQGGSILTLNNDIVQNNKDVFAGGGIFVSDSDLRLNATTVRNNSSSGLGGGIATSGHTSRLRIVDSLIANNSSDAGGGIATGGSTSDITITGSEFLGNSATSGGGGALVNGKVTLAISSSTFANNNRTGGAGGALALEGDVTSIITNVTISGNTAQTGGGVFSHTTGVQTFLNDTIAFNSATMNGGGASSGLVGGSLRFINTVVAKNTAGVRNPDVDNNTIAEAMVDAGGNFIGDNTGAASSFAPLFPPNSEGSFIGTGTSPLDPLLAPLADNGGTVVLPDGSHLLTHQSKPNSDLNGLRHRGRGTNALGIVAPTDDERGLPRPTDTLVDIGAVEFQNFDVAVGISAPAGPVRAGAPATFTLTFTNNGPNDAHGVTATFTVPAGTTVVAAPGSFTVRGNVVTFAVPDLAAGASMTFFVTILRPAAGPLTATARVSAADDLNPANDTASASVEVLPRPVSSPRSGDVTALVQVARLGRRPQKRLVFRITNVSGTPIQGPLGLMVAGPRTARLLNAGGRTAGRQAFVRLDVGGDNILDPGESVMARLVFAKPSNPRRLTVLAGAFA